MQPSSAPRQLAHELARVDLLLQVHLWRARQAHASGDPHRGLYISEAEAQEILERPLSAPHWCAAPEPPPQLLDALRDPPEPGPRMRHLIDRFRLSPFERDCLVIALAPEVDLKYERLFGFLADDITRRRPTVDVILNLLCSTFESKLAARSSFAPESPLIRHALLHLFADPSRVQPPLLDQLVRVDPRIIAFLLEEDAPEPPQGLQVNDLLLPRRQVEQIENAIRAPHAVVYLRGREGSGRRCTAEACCAAAGLRLLPVDSDAVLKSEADGFTRAVRAAFRETLLTPSAVLWANFDAFLADSRRLERQLLFEAIAQCPAPVFLGGEADWQPPAYLLNGPFVRFDLTCPSAADRSKLWTRLLGEAAATLDLRDVAARFRLNAGQIQDAAASAIQGARARGAALSQADLDAACRAHSNSRLGSLARKLEPHPRWDDMVLPPDRKQQLLEICNWARYRALVYEEWGFDRKLSLGKGLNVLFAGPPGTGKTMAAEILAGELGLDLYKLDLAGVVSKYIGETEKNLARIFAEAETSNAILFFDEADALFGKRTEVRDAHDRYANIETGYLLQRMEEYEGIAILATNLKKNLDEAFVRRMHFMLEFPLPSEQDRRRIWERIWPKDAPLSHELDLDLVAARFQITGGNIRNVALSAAFLAARDGKVITMGHLWQAMRREYQKMGKVLLDSELETLVNA